MILYSTTLLVESYVVPYEVYQEGSRMFFKPLKTFKDIETPIFWVAKIDEVWQPLNIEDPELLKQIEDNIMQHNHF